MNKKTYRQKVAKPHLDKIRGWMLENQARAVSCGGLLANAFIYLCSQWKKLKIFLDDQYIDLDNNKAERRICPIAIDRKRWLFVKSEAGAMTTAIWYSVVRTVRANSPVPSTNIRGDAVLFAGW